MENLSWEEQEEGSGSSPCAGFQPCLPSAAAGGGWAGGAGAGPGLVLLETLPQPQDTTSRSPPPLGPGVVPKAGSEGQQRPGCGPQLLPGVRNCSEGPESGMEPGHRRGQKYPRPGSSCGCTSEQPCQVVREGPESCYQWSSSPTEPAWALPRALFPSGMRRFLPLGRGRGRAGVEVAFQGPQKHKEHRMEMWLCCNSQHVTSAAIPLRCRGQQQFHLGSPGTARVKGLGLRLALHV